MAWLERWPTVEALAAASTADVVRAWSGLGYNRRAINLQRAARAVAEAGGSRAPWRSCGRCPARPVHRERGRVLRLRRPAHDRRRERPPRPRPRARRVTMRPPPAGARGSGTRRCSTSARPCVSRASRAATDARSPTAAPHAVCASSRCASRARSTARRAHAGPRSSARCTPARARFELRCGDARRPRARRARRSCATASSRSPRRYPGDPARLGRERDPLSRRRARGARRGARRRAAHRRRAAGVRRRRRSRSRCEHDGAPGLPRPIATADSPFVASLSEVDAVLFWIAGDDRRVRERTASRSTSGRALGTRSRSAPRSTTTSSRYEMSADYEAVQRLSASIVGRLEGRQYVRVTTPAGTDCTFDLSGRSWLIDDGRVTGRARSEPSRRRGLHRTAPIRRRRVSA